MATTVQVGWASERPSRVSSLVLEPGGCRGPCPWSRLVSGRTRLCCPSQPSTAEERPLPVCTPRATVLAALPAWRRQARSSLGVPELVVLESGRGDPKGEALEIGACQGSRPGRPCAAPGLPQAPWQCPAARPVTTESTARPLCCLRTPLSHQAYLRGQEWPQTHVEQPSPPAGHGRAQGPACTPAGASPCSLWWDPTLAAPLGSRRETPNSRPVGGLGPQRPADLREPGAADGRGWAAGRCAAL